jgi:hypothetical protein
LAAVSSLRKKMPQDPAPYACRLYITPAHGVLKPPADKRFGVGAYSARSRFVVDAMSF